MKNALHLSPSVMPLRGLGLTFNNTEVSKEPMLFGADGPFAFAHGGPITHAFLAALPPSWKRGDVIIDSRVAMLFPGWYPSIPGWHLDDFHRPCTSGLWAGQPALFDEHARDPEHVMCCVEATDHPTGSRTEFLLRDTYWQRRDFEAALLNGENVYEHMNKAVEALIARDGPRLQQTMHVGPGRLYRFNLNDLHRATPATGAGFRMFIRASRNVKRKVENQIRRQCNVYITDAGKGW